MRAFVFIFSFALIAAFYSCAPRAASSTSQAAAYHAPLGYFDFVQIAQCKDKSCADKKLGGLGFRFEKRVGGMIQKDRFQYNRTVKASSGKTYSETVAYEPGSLTMVEYQTYQSDKAYISQILQKAGAAGFKPKSTSQNGANYDKGFSYEYGGHTIYGLAQPGEPHRYFIGFHLMK